MTHTPGPWNLDEVRTQVGRAFRIGTGEMLVAGKGCCIIYDDYPGGDKSKQRESNARLIAAAPDLYEALRDLMARLGSDTEEESLDTAQALGIENAGSFWEAINKARNALDRADGREPTN